MASAGSASAALFTYGNPGFCAPKKPVQDFGLSSLPAVREVPASAKSFGHGAVTMHGGQQRIMPEPVPFSYGFSEQNPSGSVSLNWTITAQLWTVDRQGAALREVDRDQLFIRRLDARRQQQVEVDPLERRGFYRFDMQIANKNGKVLGSYSAYFKVVRPSWRPKLRLTRDVVWPGQRLLIRPENHGSGRVAYGESFSVQRLEEGRWAMVPELAQGPWLMWLGGLGPGETGRCNALSLPADTPPGNYRIVKQVGLRIAPRGRQAQLIAPFYIIPLDVSIEY